MTATILQQIVFQMTDCQGVFSAFASVVEQGIPGDGRVVGQRNKGSSQEDKEGIFDHGIC